MRKSAQQDRSGGPQRSPLMNRNYADRTGRIPSRQMIARVFAALGIVSALWAQGSVTYYATYELNGGSAPLWATGAAQPYVATLNAVDGAITSNAAIVPAGTNGSISAYVTHATQLILGLNRYFAP